MIDHAQVIDDVYQNLEDDNPTKKRKVLIVFDYMIADMEAIEKYSYSYWIVLKRQKTSYFTCFYITCFYFKVRKDIRLNATHYFIMKIPNKKELQQKGSNHSSDTRFHEAF